MDRHWLLTWRTYGTWLPGDARGSVTRVRIGAGSRVEHDMPDSAMDGPMPGLEAAARSSMLGSTVLLDRPQADAVTEQLRETAQYRGWRILAAAVMANHIHLVVGVLGDPSPDKLLGDFKAWGTRCLNRRWGERPNGTWWAQHGSKRKLPDEKAVENAIEYVRNQPTPLAMWVTPANGPARIGERPRANWRTDRRQPSETNSAG